MNIASVYAENLTTQGYVEKTSIDGVELIQLKMFADDGGNFLELFRLSDGNIEGTASPFTARQISLSIMEPQVTKAYHIHKSQDDLWFVPPQHRLLVNLHDLRDGSSTFDVHKRLVLGGGQAQLLRIPTGVAHGVKNCYTTPMFLIYATSQQFNPNEPDEFRLPWDHFGSDVWDLQKG